MTAKLLIVGLDGADYQWCEAFSEVMPNLSRLRSVGVYGLLKSLRFPSTPACWFSIYTGCNPSEHRIEGFRRKAMWDVKRRLFWDYFDCPVGLVNLPLVCHAGGQLDGFIVPGFYARWQPYPADLRMIDNYLVDAVRITDGRITWLSEVKKFDAAEVKKRQNRFRELQRRVENRRVDAVADLINKFPIDVLFIGIMMLDRVGHAFAHHEPTMRDFYRRADILLGRLIEIVSPENIVVFSDHGMDASDSGRIPESVVKNDEKRLAKSRLKVRPRGMHTRDGIVLFTGPDVRANGAINAAELRDVAPTILQMCGIKKPGTMSGKVLSVFNDITKEEEAILLEMLEGLGYA